ncbi:hypothetical protein BGZ93_002546 [Podila epicladia]|nr:hypothetical protein BGZ93_002546 [Podila epicladia]
MALALIVLVFLDRNMDLVPVVNHSLDISGSRSGCDGHELNEIVVQTKENGRQVKKKDDIKADFFWNKNDSATLSGRKGKDAAVVSQMSGVNNLDDVSQLFA